MHGIRTPGEVPGQPPIEMTLPPFEEKLREKSSDYCGMNSILASQCAARNE